MWTHPTAPPFRLVLLLLGSVVTGACTGFIQSPPTVPPNARSAPCPTILPIARTGCPGIAIPNPQLVCGGDGTMSIATNPVGTGGTRFVVRLQDESNLSGTVTPSNGFCAPGISVGVGITFGVVYTGDQGTEPAAGGGTIPCITRSRTQFTQYMTSDPVLAIAEDTIKGEIHGALDRAVINSIFVAAGAPPLPGRCARWQPMSL
jgi:hypothetical protein